VVFVKSEAVGLLHNGWSKDKVLAAYMRAMAIRMCELLKRVGIKKDFVITGGQSKNIDIVTRIENILGVKRLPVADWEETGLDPMTAGAIGVALFAEASYSKSLKRHACMQAREQKGTLRSRL